MALVAGVVAVLVAAGIALAAMGGEDEPRTASSAGDDAVGREEIAFAGADGFTIRGSLDLPRDAEGGGRPGVVIVPGFGPTVREGVRQAGGRIDDLYVDLGDTLARHGFVVLRYDKRGTGESTPLPDASETVFDDHVEDAAAAAEFLGNREEVDSSDLAVVGHDQGGLVGMRVAAADEPKVSALALIATPGRPLVDAVADEIRNGDFADEESADELAAEFTDAVDELVATGQVPEVSEPLQPVLPSRSADYLASIFTLDPTELAGDVDVPVLIARGEHDPGVREHDVETLQTAFTSAPVVEVLRVPDAGSTLARASAPDENDHEPEESTDETDGSSSSSSMHPHPEGAANPPRDEDALRRLAEWLDSALHG